MLISVEKGEKPPGGLNSSQCEVMFTNTPLPWRCRKPASVGTCLADHGQTDGAGFAAGAAAGSQAWRKAASGAPVVPVWARRVGSLHA